LNWQSVLLGMALCLVLVVFMGSKGQEGQAGGLEQKTLQRAATTSDVWDKSIQIEKWIIAMDKQLNRMEQKNDALAEEVHQILKIVRGMDRLLEKNIKN
jgi:Flp pilus assembly protein TadB